MTEKKYFIPPGALYIKFKSIWRNFIMNTVKSERIKEELNQAHQHIKSGKTYSKLVPVNDKLHYISKLPSRLRGAASFVYDALELHVNNNLIAYVSQDTLATETGYTRQWVCYILGKLHEIGLIHKIRKGLNKANEYILVAKQNLIQKLSEYMEAKKEELKEQHGNGKQNYKSAKNDNFNNFEQREYDYDDLERKLLGWNDPLLE
jgi:hypothetical protein